jgi:predicted N-acetyltransferase YhbS
VTEIRLARDADWPAVLDVHRRAFGGDDVPRIADELRASDAHLPELSFVAVQGHDVVGHVVNTWVEIEDSPRRLLQLSPLGVLPELQGHGIGSALVRASLDAVRARGEPALVIEGNPRYYGRFGFVRADELGLLPPPEVLHDWAFQIAVLDPEADLPRGRVVYPPPFSSIAR